MFELEKVFFEHEEVGSIDRVDCYLTKMSEESIGG